MVSGEDFPTLFAALQAKYDQFLEGAYLDEQGTILEQTENSVLGEAEAYPLLLDWAQHHKNLNYGGVKYSTLKSDPVNLSTYNVHLKEGVVGSITRNKKFVVARVRTADFIQLGNSAILLGIRMWEL
ncbi:MAG: hypothetical protein RBG13Loki_3644 [Promethearchaeota archaeon CR_4]|nr:MAG: hypothetical protein RBG13Loki_3644 [Candidatus Lokiarchaeota archaeon CR_4]